MRPDPLEVVTTIGDTIVDHRVVDGDRYAPAWAPAIVVALPAGATTARATIGLAEITLARTPRLARTLPYPSRIDRRAARYLVISLAVHLMLWGVATDRAPEEAIVPVVTYRPQHYVAARSPAFVPKAERAAVVPGLVTRDTAAGVGRSNIPIANPKRAAPTTSTVAAPAAAPTRADAIEMARTAGILGTQLVTTELAPSSAALAEGFDHPIYGGSAPPETTFGGTVMSPGGGGTCTTPPCGTIGSAAYQTVGGGQGGGDGFGIGGGRGGLANRSSGPICTLTVTSASSNGGLDKGVIRRYLQRQIEKLTYCYETQLLADPTLEGTVDLDFTITAEGTPIEVQAKGVHPQVASCVVEVVRAIRFPRSLDGPSRVHYPLSFRAARP